MKSSIRKLALSGALLLAQAGVVSAQDSEIAPAKADHLYRWVEVSGTAIHYFSTAQTHAEQATASGIRRYTTDTIELSGDLQGRVLYQPVTEIDFQTNTLVNRGNQVFSGTVLGIGPVMLHDDQFRFEVDLTTGQTVGKIRLTNRIAGPLVRCFLDAVGTGMTPEGDGLADYTGRCRMFRNPDAQNRW